MTLGSLVETHGYWVLAVGCLVGGETILVLAGFAAHRGYLDPLAVVAIASVCGFLGDQFYFWMGRRHGASVLARWPSLASQTNRVNRLLDRFHVVAIIGVRFALWLADRRTSGCALPCSMPLGPCCGPASWRVSVGLLAKQPRSRSARSGIWKGGSCWVLLPAERLLGGSGEAACAEDDRHRQRARNPPSSAGGTHIEALCQDGGGSIWLRLPIRRGPSESIDRDRSRKVSSGQTARKPAPKVTAKVCGSAASALRINSLEGSLMIEWEWPKSYAKLLMRCRVLRMLWHAFTRLLH